VTRAATLERFAAAALAWDYETWLAHRADSKRLGN
jgi:hypothetical protein